MPASLLPGIGDCPLVNALSVGLVRNGVLLVALPKTRSAQKITTHHVHPRPRSPNTTTINRNGPMCTTTQNAHTA